ncbi:MAG TPA: hypothetical protein VMB81_25900 [Candidatus Sulfotelmatobacter sp.]|nr:hypothetical protein [Candidatus Sulfotelmatobacter sp.]
MDLPLTAASGVDVYTALHRLLSPSTQPTTLPVTDGTPPPRFQLPAVIATPAPGAAAPLPPPPPIALPQPGAPVAATPAAPTGATASRALALYAQIQQLVSGAPPAQLPTAHDVTAGPAPADAGAAVQPPPPGQPAGSLGINALGGAAQSPVQTLSFPRGSFVNFLT